MRLFLSGVSCVGKTTIEQRLEKWTHNKAIQKAVESYRISDEAKAYLADAESKIRAGTELNER